jgi:hypothetical protein
MCTAAWIQCQRNPAWRAKALVKAKLFLSMLAVFLWRVGLPQETTTTCGRSEVYEAGKSKITYEAENTARGPIMH